MKFYSLSYVDIIFFVICSLKNEYVRVNAGIDYG